MSKELVDSIARRFIARSDAKAIQDPNGEYQPARVGGDVRAPTIPWSRDDLVAHLAKKATFGHYFLDHDSTTKLFALDIDLETEGLLPSGPEPEPGAQSTDWCDWDGNFEQGNPREAWRNRAHHARPYLKRQFREIAEQFARVIHRELEVECAVAYSGNKGLHVYGFTGRTSAENARDAALITLELVGGFELQKKRASTWKHTSKWQHLSIEVYPKQIELSGGGFGNLMRLPLGVNTKAPKDPTFFVDLTAPLAELRPGDPVWALTEGAKNPWVSPS